MFIPMGDADFVDSQFLDMKSMCFTLKLWFTGSGKDTETDFSFSNGSRFVEDVNRSARLALQKDSS